MCIEVYTLYIQYLYDGIETQILFQPILIFNNLNSFQNKSKVHNLNYETKHLQQYCVRIVYEYLNVFKVESLFCLAVKMLCVY